MIMKLNKSRRFTQENICVYVEFVDHGHYAGHVCVDNNRYDHSIKRNCLLIRIRQSQ